MIHHKNLILVGTSHIAKQSIEEVKEVFEKYRPEIIALELDKLRLQGLISKKRKVRSKDIRKIGLKGFIFALVVSYIENKLGKLVGTKPGAEMLEAINLAIKNKKQILLIDQDIRITLKKLSKRITWKEKLCFLQDMIMSLFINQKTDLNKVPEKEIINEMINALKVRYPTIHQVLVVERNEIMAKNLNRAMIDNKDKEIMAIVGAGHQEEIIRLVKNEQR